MDSYYVYDNRTTNRSRVHRGDCPNCNQGRGKMRRPSARHGRWHGPFYERDEAFDFARRLKRGALVACETCLP